MGGKGNWPHKGKCWMGGSQGRRTSLSPRTRGGGKQPVKKSGATKEKGCSVLKK